MSALASESDTGAWGRAWAYYWLADPYRGQGYNKSSPHGGVRLGPG
ncbi:hypothetical protein [Rothia nasimurium]|nr:hypothetical protein [Rothia nasimurium]